MPLETDRAVVLNIIAMEVEEDDLNELGFEWLFNFNVGPKPLFAGGVTEYVMSELAGLPSISTEVSLPERGLSATEGLRSGRMVLASDNIDDLISTGRAGLFNANGAHRQKAPGIFAFRGVWDSGDVTMIMRGASQKKGTDVLSNPRIIFTPGREEQVVFGNVNEMFYPDTYAEPQIESVNFTLPSKSGGNSNKRTSGHATMAAPAHPESFIRFGMVDETVGGIGTVVQVHEADVAPDGQHVTLALTVTMNEFEGFVNWGSPITTALITDEAKEAVPMILTENMILKPVFKRRMENTKLTVGSGAVVVMGGLKESRSVRYEDKLPIMGDLPMVGRLFRSEGEEKIRKAFLMFVKVDIVDPTGRVIGTGERPADVTRE